MHCGDACTRANCAGDRLNSTDSRAGDCTGSAQPTRDFCRGCGGGEAGIFAAHKVSGSTATIQVIEVGDDVEQVGSALAAARDRGVRVAIGPLRRDEVNAIVEGGRAVLPLVTLNFPDRDAGAPATMIAFALSAEAEADRVVQIALASFVNLRPGVSTGARIMVLAGTGAIERRIAQAYVNHIARGWRGTGDDRSDARCAGSARPAV